MSVSSRCLIIPALLALFLAMGQSVASIETSTLPQVPIDVHSTTPGLKARSEELELPETSESSTQILKVYPVYPEYRANTEKPFKSSANPISVKSLKTSSKDSYLDALEHSHTKKHQRDGVVHFEKPKGGKLIRRNYEGPVYRPSGEYGAPASLSTSVKTPRIANRGPTDSFIPTPSSSYSLPVQHAVKFGEQNAYGSGVYSAPSGHYVLPSGSYGTPSVSYGPPAGSYGPPGGSYGPPQNIHAHAQSQQGWSGYALPEMPQLPTLPSIDFAWPLAIKFNAFTIAKILLKLVIFKMIVKFIAIICLLLFIPKLEIKSDKDDKDDDEGRKLITDDSIVERMNVLTAVVHEAIGKYRDDNPGVDHSEECNSVNCTVRRLLRAGDSWSDYAKLFNSYADEEESIEAEEKNSIDT